MTRVALASLPFFEASVNSEFYGFWRAWQLIRCLTKALARCVCLFHHISIFRKYGERGTWTLMDDTICTGLNRVRLSIPPSPLPLVLRYLIRTSDQLSLTDVGDLSLIWRWSNRRFVFLPRSSFKRMKQLRFLFRNKISKSAGWWTTAMTYVYACLLYELR